MPKYNTLSIRSSFTSHKAYALSYQVISFHLEVSLKLSNVLIVKISFLTSSLCLLENGMLIKAKRKAAKPPIEIKTIDNIAMIKDNNERVLASGTGSESLGIFIVSFLISDLIDELIEISCLFLLLS